MSRVTQDTARYQVYFVYGSITLYGETFQNSSTINLFPILQSCNPPITEITGVWAIPLSLATTQGITIVLFSSRYLDVSVPWVCFPYCYGMWRLQRHGLPHSEIHGSRVICTSPWLIAAYHVLLRL